MPNPFTQLRTGAATAAALVSGIEWTDQYNGETPDRVLALIARKGSGVMVRVVAGQKDQDSGKTRDDTDTLVHFIVGAASLHGRATALENAEALLWSLYSAMKDNKLNLAWLFCGLQWRDWETIAHSPQGVVLSVIFATRFDMREWT